MAAPFTLNPQRITDGVIAPAGAPYDSILAATVDLGGGIEWDLGQAVRVRRAWLQADNNERCVLMVSDDRRHWTTAWEAPPVAEPGLQSRSTTELDVRGRYLRLELRGGDRGHSVSELAVSSSPEGPWPPPFVVSADERLSIPAHPPVRGPLQVALALAASLLLFPLVLRWATARSFGRWLGGFGSVARRLLGSALRAPSFWAAGGAALFLTSTALSYAALHRYNLVDDAYISLQYAKELASGAGLVFNPGERVEGYTNFLWVLLLAPLWIATGESPALMATASTWLAMLLAILALAGVACVGARLLRRWWLAASCAVLYLAFDDTFVSYTVVFALENHLLVALLVAGLALAVLRPRHWTWALGATFALACMTRWDAALWGGAFLLAVGRGLFDSQRPVWGFSRRALLRVALGFVVLFAPYFVARWLYFGALLPNTFYLKTGETLDALPRGLEYIRSYFEQRHWVPLAALPALLEWRKPWVRWLIYFVALHLAYVAYVGGDFYAGHRFLFVVTPCFALLVGATLGRWVGGWRSAKEWVAVLAAVAGLLAIRHGTLRSGPFSIDLHERTTTVDNNVKYMQWLKGVARPKATMVVGDIGATGFFADVAVVDVFGVVDAAVAHKEVPGFGTGHAGHEKKMSREEQLAADPTYIKWGYVGDAQRPPGYYIFNDFPPYLRVEGLWVKDDRGDGRPIPATALHFDPGQWRGWLRQGTAFRAGPVRSGARGQRFVMGHSGYFVNTYTEQEGDDAVGRLVSTPFELVGDSLRLLVGGGRDPERLRVSLLVDGRRVYSETGTCWETLGRRSWDLRPYRGRSARLEIVDQATGAWGHLLVDEVEQWSGGGDRQAGL